MPYMSISRMLFNSGATIALCAIILSCNPGSATDVGRHSIVEVNAAEIAKGNTTIAITGALIVDGRGGEPIANGCVIVKDGIIEEVGVNGTVKIPEGAEVVDAKGMTLLPGFIDSHFHLDNAKDLPAKSLQHGVTSVRDPGAWIESYSEERKSGKPLPRLFLSGPHIDMFPPAYPDDSYVVRDADEAIRQVNKMADSGATMIKIYFRLPPSIIRAVCETAHHRGIPVTGHLETTEAMEAIDAGLDGIEHITSFGLSLQSKREGEKYRQAILADNEARKPGRYNVWKNIDINSALADTLTSFLVRKGTFVTPTLAVFEIRVKNKDSLDKNGNPFNSGEGDSSQLQGFNQMKAFTAKLQKAGVRIVVGSHSQVNYAEEGWAYQRELEIYAESGISNNDIIVAATMQNARFFRIDDKLGSIEKGKLADLTLINGNPLKNISDARNIAKVMLNGVWIKAIP
ncbi:MAG: amidohydrolase family protein [Flavitalea sp.]